jgi:hypothetical protein
MFPSSLRVCPSRVPVRQHHRRRLGASRAYRATPRDLSVNTFDLLPFVAPRPPGKEGELALPMCRGVVNLSGRTGMGMECACVGREGGDEEHLVGGGGAVYGGG